MTNYKNRNQRNKSGNKTEEEFFGVMKIKGRKCIPVKRFKGWTPLIDSIFGDAIVVGKNFKINYIDIKTAFVSEKSLRNFSGDFYAIKWNGFFYFIKPIEIKKLNPPIKTLYDDPGVFFGDIVNDVKIEKIIKIERS